ncbi:MAG: cation:proton antiporter [Anaerolineae bacterium]
MTAAPDALRQVLLALAAIVVTGHGLARLFARFGQPPVIGEVVAGIVLGPSLIGAKASAWILPPGVAPHLGTIAQLGVVLYMFMVGLELDMGALRGRRLTVGAIALAGIGAPFALGVGLAYAVHGRLAPPGVPLLSFALFIGVAMSVTAFPVLARILADRALSDTALGRLALAAAALGDVAAWCLLALVVGVATARPGDGMRVVAGAIAFIALAALVARPILRRWAARADADFEAGAPPRGAVAALLAAVLVAAATTEAIGLHALFGAFLIGAVIPADSAVARDVPRRLDPVVTGLLLPAFFAFTGMRTRIGLVHGAALWWTCAAVIAAATIGKFGGTLAAARLSGLGWRDGAVLGTLMNTRGLMELIVLNVGLELGILSPTLFAIMVLMALATTMMTGPALGRLLRPGSV